ncbi:hypothetical protein [uncultured Mediterranean phage]|nr:hypothetical protein [uncultured Mediterranean phage]
MPSATPIRLVQENGNLIELDAQEMVLTTTRKVGGSAIPFTGSKRVGFDLNVNQAMINIRGVIADDRSAGASTAASAVINFAKGSGAYSGSAFTTSTNLTALLGQKLEITDLSGTKRYITFTSTGSGVARHNSGNDDVLINLSEADSTVVGNLASAVNTCINDRFSAALSSTVVQTADSVGVEDNWGVSISMVAKGAVSNNGTPRFLFDGGTSNFYSPDINTFSGGSLGKKKSAGDKAMDLYGILNNSVTQAGRVLLGLGMVAGGAAIAIATGGLGIAAGAAVAGVGIAAIDNSGKEADYITGLQIPYNSTIKAEDGELYTARNFFMPTGWFGVTGSDKTSEGNDHPASVRFSQGDQHTGIQGAVQKLDIMYDAGETVYNFNMIFAPIDGLL